MVKADSARIALKRGYIRPAGVGGTLACNVYHARTWSRKLPMSACESGLASHLSAISAALHSVHTYGCGWR